VALFSKKKEISKDLDVPPIPPPHYDGGFHTTLSAVDEEISPEIPSQLPPLPEPPQMEFHDVHQDIPVVKKKFNLFGKKEKPALPELPPLPEASGDFFPEIPPIPEVPHVETPIPPPVVPEPPLEPVAVPSEKYLKVQDFRALTEYMNSARRGIRGVVGSPSGVSGNEGLILKEIESWKKTMIDVQRKLAYIDKTFFKGDR